MKNVIYQNLGFIKLCLLSALALLPVHGQTILTAGPIKFKLFNIDRLHRSEGVAVADVEKDGDMDILVGDYWYEAPSWTKHEIRTPGIFSTTDYSEAFACFTEDFNGDGYPDLLVMPYGGKEVKWYENPKGGLGRWIVHTVGYSYYNEQPIFVDLKGTGAKYLISSNTDAQFAAYRPGTDPNATWTKTPISGVGAPNANQWSHGLGIGDINGDGRQDVITQEGWYEHPAGTAPSWVFRPSKFNTLTGDQPSNIFAFDINKDGRMDLVTGNAHGYGVWWYEQLPGNVWKTNLIDNAVSENHSLNFGDMDGDGSPDIITGKRWYAHNGLDPGGNDAAVLFWIKYNLVAGVPTFKKYVINADGGIGINFVTADFNNDGLTDICVSNKKGVKMYYQEGTALQARKIREASQGSSNLKIHRQPSGPLTVDFQSSGAFRLRAVSLSGKIFFDRKAPHAGFYHFELKDLPAGVYSLELEIAGKKTSKTIMESGVR